MYFLTEPSETVSAILPPHMDESSTCLLYTSDAADEGLGVERDDILLLGTRTDLVGEWSGATDPKRKLAKLQWMAEVLQHLGFLV